MSCVGLFISACSLCAAMMGMYRAKLKARYFFACTLIVTTICMYYQMPSCAVRSKLYFYSMDSSVQKGNRQNYPFMNGRELLDDGVNQAGQQPNESDSREIEIATATIRSQFKYEKIFKTKNLENENLLDTFRDKENVYFENDFNYKDYPQINVNTEEEDEEEDEEEEEEDEYYPDDVESPKRNFNESYKVLKRNEDDPHNSPQINNLFSQMKVEGDLQEKYLYENVQHENLLPHFTPQEIKSKMMDILPWWELLEMERYPRVWFVGENANKTSYNESDPFNYGFDRIKDDDHEGRLKIVKRDHLEYRYEILEKIGSGSFGSVVRAVDHALPTDDVNHLVAIKVIHNDSSAEKYFKQELDMMNLVDRSTNSPEHFSTFLRTFLFRNHLCIVLQLLGKTLDDAHVVPLLDMKILRKYTSDILNGLVLLHKVNIIHGDLKPENVMFTLNCNLTCPVFLKIADFNLACIQNSKDYACPGRYFQTRYYRAPEVIMDLIYDTTADMWSLGVMLVELFLYKVPFYGETTTDQLAAIMEVLGLLPPYMVETSPRIRTYQKAICYVCENGFHRVPYRKSLTTMLQDVPPQLYDFIKKCLVLDPKKRMTSSDALRHPFVTGGEGR